MIMRISPVSKPCHVAALSLICLALSTVDQCRQDPRVRERLADARALRLPRVQQADDQILTRGRDAVRCHAAH